MFWMYQRVFYGRLDNEANRGLSDLSLREVVVLLPIVVFIFWLGVKPSLVLDKLEASVDRVLTPVTEELRIGTATDGHHAADPGERSWMLVQGTEEN
jgi:NADH-quinone oxidoreductase subunit M